MPEYLSPGVYVEEIEIGSKPIEGVSTSTAGFLGEAERGPTAAALVTNWLQYQRVFGSYFGADKYLPYAVKGFFDNGGQRCYIGRIVKQSSETATISLTAGSSDVLTVSAVGEGTWGNWIALKLSAGSFSKKDNPLFKLSVSYWKKEPASLYDPESDAKTRPRPDVTEIFDNLSLVENSPDYYIKRINGISDLITVSEISNSASIPDGPAAITYLTGGSDGTGNLVLSDFQREDTDDDPANRKGLTAFKTIDDISIVYVPNVLNISGLAAELITHCETMKDRFAVLDAEQGSAKVSDLNPRDNYDTKYAAYYYPWIKIVDSEAGLMRTIPPGGHVAGIYARSDTERGVHKAPANEPVRGAADLEFQITRGEQDILNPRGVNVIRAFPGRGIRVWGARTLSSDPLWKYINLRRLFLFLEESIDKGNQWVVFEPNNEKLWARVKSTITEFLTRVWRDGALMGTKAEEAFFVKVDRSTMTQSDIDNGRLIVLIGVAPVKPAEFVIFRIAQWAGGSTVTE
ncbi:phage tail sheath family protein [Desulfosporosinus sp. BG]|uniref:phage tail sheath family protein n=1 Tax=Desulfosporosinus sp. BG TaxID=1633135 RepID=UPI00083A5817|nr:phage tail sheath family protein [Desulfosporosinus sp. BG]ODA40660.1 Phage tail sheath protein FI [Desulfosporosinus sp. BG]